MARCFLRSDDESLGELIESEKWKEVLLRLEAYPSEAREWHMVRNFFGPKEQSSSSANGDNALSIGSKGSTDEEDSEEDSSEEDGEEQRNPSNASVSSSSTPLQSDVTLPTAVATAKNNLTVKSEVLPLHVACARRPPKNVIAALLKTYTNSIQCKESSYQRLPLHIACRYGSSASVIRLLLEHFPHAALVKDKLGRLPLHYACGHRAPPEVVKLLMSGNIRVVTVADLRGWLPLHVACAAGASTNVVRALIRPYPESVVVHTNKNRTPLCLVHEGSNRRSKSQLFQVLVDAETNLYNKKLPDDLHEKDGMNFKGANRALRRGRRMLRDLSLYRNYDDDDDDQSSCQYSYGTASNGGGEERVHTTLHII